MNSDSPTEEMRRTKQSIETLRQRLHQLIGCDLPKDGAIKEEIVELSRELDKQIVSYYRRTGDGSPF